MKTVKKTKAALMAMVAGAALLSAVSPAVSAASAPAPLTDASPQARAPIPGIHYIRPVSAPDKCITVHGWDNKNGAIIDQWTCQGQKNQRWNFMSNGFVYWAKSESSNRCLDAGDLKKGRKITQWTCHTGYNQEVHPVPRGNAYELVVHGKCLDVEGGSKGNGARIILWKCKNVSNQRFYLN